MKLSEIVNSEIKWTYDNLNRNPSKYLNKIIYFEGTVLQSYSFEKENYYGLLISITNNFGRDRIWVEYEGARFLEGDYLKGYIEGDGLYTYTSIENIQITIPTFNFIYFKNNKINKIYNFVENLVIDKILFN
jgi:hypothetical protein